MKSFEGKTLYYLGEPKDGYGWGVANTNLVKELSALCAVQVITTDRTRFDGPVFTPVAQYTLRPERTIKAPRVIAYGFWEFHLHAEAARHNAERYHWIFAGSEWCADRVRKATGSSRVSALIQGVDFARFTPQSWNPNRKGFRVFSGGKYEFRKAQDVVIAAMKVFMSQRKDVVLVTSWHNPWPATMSSMDQSWLIEPDKPFDGLDMSRVFNLPPMSNADMPRVYGESDVGLFPNRCEAGNNMVMCEMMACARPVIGAAATGQAEVLQGYPLNVTQGSYDLAGWFNADVSDCLVQLERCYQHREKLLEWGNLARDHAETLSWKRCAEIIVQKAFGP
jgi:glycosyltransferase involved in cell wall biosynthesis